MATTSITTSSEEKVTTSLQDSLQHEATIAVQSNATAVLITLMGCSLILYLFYSKQIAPRLDKGLARFEKYLDEQIIALKEVGNNTGSLANNVSELKKATEVSISSLQERIVELDRRIESNHAEVINLKIMISAIKDK
jgi:hypothetical protein